MRGLMALEFLPYLRNAADAYPKGCRQLLHRKSGFRNGLDNVRRQLFRGVDPCRSAPPVPRVFDVVPCRSKNEMFWVATRRIIASMPDYRFGVFLRFLDWPIFKLVSQSVRQQRFSFISKRTVSEENLPRDVRPAIVGSTFQYLRFKPFDGVRSFSIPACKTRALKRAILCFVGIPCEFHRDLPALNAGYGDRFSQGSLRIDYVNTIAWCAK